MQKQHTVLCIQDLSCVGRCSLAVVLPALAAMGVQPCALPTALLSTHTGGLGRPARTDESGFISAALAHYAQLGLAFDCVYSGYLAGAAQVALVEQAFRQAPAALKLVDPVMADHGRPYASMTPEILTCSLPFISTQAPGVEQTRKITLAQGLVYAHSHRV